MFPTAHPKVIEQAKKFLAKDPIFIDTETTGFSPDDVVIEIGVVNLAGEVLFEALVNPSMQIPQDAVAIHGITDAMVAEAPGWKEVWPELEAVMAGRLVGMYNAEFDLRMLKQTHQRHWLEWTLDDQYFFCVMKFYAAFYGQIGQRSREYKLHKLEAAGAACGIPLPNSHRAVDDAKLTAALFKYIAAYQP